MRPPIPIPDLSQKEQARFWRKVDIRGENECWPWTGGRGRTRHQRDWYGIWKIKQGGPMLYLRPHRVAYALLIGPIPDGLTIDHVVARGCTSKLCCNPQHLEPITQAEQIARRVRKQAA